MKNYIVKATRDFTDYDGRPTIVTNPHVERKTNEEFKCTKKRFEYLKQHGAVILLKIEKKTD